MTQQPLMRLIKDESSSTGVSAAILIRNVRPRRKLNGDWHVAETEFKAIGALNCDGYKVRPTVKVSIMCKQSAFAAAAAKKQRELDRAREGSPILK